MHRESEVHSIPVEDSLQRLNQSEPVAAVVLNHSLPLELVLHLLAD